MRLAARIVVGIFGVVTAFLALGWIFVPERLSGYFGLEMMTTLGYSTARADLGGFFLALTAFCALGLRGGKHGRSALAALAVVVAGAAAGRVIGLIADGIHPDALQALAVELLVIVAAVIARRPALA